MKIKQEKQLNLPQLIEHIWENEKRGFSVISNMNSIVALESNGKLNIQPNIFYPEETFTVTVEEEITEDTKLDLVERFIGGMGSVCYTSHTMSIKECLKRNPSDITTTHFYIENDDRELILIWRDGKLI